MTSIGHDIPDRTLEESNLTVFLIAERTGCGSTSVAFVTPLFRYGTMLGCLSRMAAHLLHLHAVKFTLAVPQTQETRLLPSPLFK